MFTHVYEMFDLDPANWATLVAQLVKASVWSAVPWVQIPPEATHFSFFHCLRCPCLSVFLSFFHLKSSCTCMYFVNNYIQHILNKYLTC